MRSYAKLVALQHQGDAARVLEQLVAQALQIGQRVGALRFRAERRKVGARDQLVAHVVQPHHIGERIVRAPHVVDVGAHQPVHVELVVAAGREQLIVGGQIVEEHVAAAAIDARQRVVDDGAAHAVRGQTNVLAAQPERAVRLLRADEQNVAPVQVAMLELELLFGHGQRDGDLEATQNGVELMADSNIFKQHEDIFTVILFKLH